MSETLISRVLRIVSGTVHDAMDTVEAHEAETVMRQALREMDQTISEVKIEISKSNGNRLLAVKRLEMTDAKLRELSDKARVALREKRDDLAESAVARQLDLEAQIPILEKSKVSAAKKCDELEGYLQALVDRKCEMKSELGAYIEMRGDNVTSLIPKDGARASHLEGRADHAMESFDRAINSGGEVVGYTASDGKTVVHMGELNSIIRKNRISERLAALKAECE